MPPEPKSTSVLVQRRIVSRGERAVHFVELRRQAQRGFAVVAVAAVQVEVAVAGDDVEVAARIHRRREPGHPDAGEFGAGRVLDRVERRAQLQRRAVAQQPAGDAAGVVVAVRADADVDRAVRVGEAGAIPLVLRVEPEFRAVAEVGARRDRHRRLRVRAGAEVERMQFRLERGRLRLGRRDQIDRRGVGGAAHDHRGAGDAVFRDHVGAADIARRLRRAERNLPQRRVGLRIVGKDAVVAGRDDQHVARLAVRHDEIRDQQRLREHIAVHLQRLQQAEFRGSDGRDREVGLALVPAGAQRVVVERGDVDRRAGIFLREPGRGVRVQRRVRQHARRVEVRLAVGVRRARRRVGDCGERDRKPGAEHRHTDERTQTTWPHLSAPLPAAAVAAATGRLGHCGAECTGVSERVRGQ